VRGEIRHLELDVAGAPVGESKVLMAGRKVLEPRGVRAARMSYRSFGRGYGLGQGRSQEETGAGGART
jgi:hypothetical protein